MIITNFFKIISFLTLKRKSIFINIKYAFLKIKSIREIKNFINTAELYDVISEFIQFSDLYQQYYGKEIPIDNIIIEPPMVQNGTNKIYGRKIVYIIEDIKLSLKIEATIEPGDKNKIISFKILDKIHNKSLDSWAMGSIQGSDGMMIITNNAIRMYTNYAMKYIFKYGL